MTPDPADLIRQAARDIDTANQMVLDAREGMRRAVFAAYNQGMTYQQIADLLDISRQRVAIIAKG